MIPVTTVTVLAQISKSDKEVIPNAVRNLSDKAAFRNKILRLRSG